MGPSNQRGAFSQPGITSHCGCLVKPGATVAMGEDLGAEFTRRYAL